MCGERAAEYRGKTYTAYEATQKQRQIERAMRKCKREIVGNKAAGQTEAAQDSAIRLGRLSKEYKAFSSAAGLRTQPERAMVQGFGNKEAGAARSMSSEKIIQKIGRSVGAKAKNYDVYNPKTGDFVNLAEGSRITQPKNHIMAGAGREREIDCIEWLVDKHGGDALKWTKEKGFGYIIDEYGETRKVEIHWYQEPSVGKVEMKIKIRDGRVYIDEE